MSRRGTRGSVDVLVLVLVVDVVMVVDTVVVVEIVVVTVLLNNRVPCLVSQKRKGWEKSRTNKEARDHTP